MQFDQFGYLTPYNVIETDLDTVETVFVNAFSDSLTRRAIFDQYAEYLAGLQATVGTGFVQWLDGSFTTRKTNPRDIDFVTFLNVERLERHHELLNALRQTHRQPGNLTDGYFVAVYPEGHRLRSHYESDLLDWQEIFGKTRFTRRGDRRKNKGFVQITFL